MDAFEQLAADIFWSEGYWVRTSVKVELTREDKIAIDRHSSPRWELDLVAYQPMRDELLALECKSYLDSGGVHAAHFLPGSKYAHRYKLFHDAKLRDVILTRLKSQFEEAGLCKPATTVGLGLVHAHATPGNATKLTEIFEAGGWLLFGPGWLKSHVSALSKRSYENSIAAVVAKLLIRPGG